MRSTEITPGTTMEQQGAPTIPSPGMSSPFGGSIPSGQATSEVLRLSIRDALDRDRARNDYGAAGRTHHPVAGHELAVRRQHSERPGDERGAAALDPRCHRP